MEAINYKPIIQALCERVPHETPFIASLSNFFFDDFESISILILKFSNEKKVSDTIYFKGLNIKGGLYNENECIQTVNDLENLLHNNKTEDYGKHI